MWSVGVCVSGSVCVCEWVCVRECVCVGLPVIMCDNALRRFYLVV